MADKKGLVGEFKEFIMRGNVMDMAVGVIIGGAFGTIITSLVEDILTPIIGMLGGNPDFSSISIGGGIMIGNFINAVLNFLIIGLCMFLVVKAFNAANKKLEKPAEEEAPTTKTCPFCKTEISIEATRCPNCTSELPAEE
ncbi:MAG: large conductance mechanosensitive channel protein MscL [Lachnospiraceae bacterium]|nr:large conductance mechanosensitive channel protein MscL [Lachnospiraceae bacterium]